MGLNYSTAPLYNGIGLNCSTAELNHLEEGLNCFGIELNCPGVELNCSRVDWWSIAQL